MSCTCKSWWTQSQRWLWLLGRGHHHQSLAPQHPWLLLPHAPASSQHLTFMDLFDAKLRNVKLPVPVRGGWCCGSSKGWLFIAYGSEHHPNLFLVNPVSGHTLPLPPISSIPGCYQFTQHLSYPYNAATFITKLELSKSSPMTSDCVAAGLIFGNATIVFCRVGDSSWTLLGEHVDYGVYANLFNEIKFYDIVFSANGTKLYVSTYTDMTGRMSVIQTGQTTLSELEVTNTNGMHSSKISLFQTQIEVVLNFIPNSFGPQLGGMQVHNNYYIVEKHVFWVYLVVTSQGKLLEVHKIMDLMQNKSDPEGPEGVVEDDERSRKRIPTVEYYTTTGFQVFSVDPVNGHKCMLHSLEEEDDVIFVGERGSFSMCSRDFRDGLIQGDCIYFLEDSNYGLQVVSPNISRESGVFYLKTGKIQKHIPSIRFPIVSSMVWFTPNTF